MTELLDIVNDADEVTGQASRAEVHRLKHRHRATHMLLSNSRGEVFVQLRSYSKDNSPGLWDTSAAGHVDAGESYMACAVREVYEELGITIVEDQLEFLCRITPSADNGFEFVMAYCIQSDDPLTLQPDEIADGRWLSPASLDDWIREQPAVFTRDFPQLWQKARSSIISR